MSNSPEKLELTVKESDKNIDTNNLKEIDGIEDFLINSNLLNSLNFDLENFSALYGNTENLSSQIKNKLTIQRGKEGKYLLAFDGEKIGYVKSKEKFEKLKNNIEKYLQIEIVIDGLKQEQKDLKKDVLTKKGLEIEKLGVESLCFLLKEKDLPTETLEKINKNMAEKLINNPDKISTAVDNLGEDKVKNKIIHNYFLDTEGFMEKFIQKKDYLEKASVTVNGEKLEDVEKKEYRKRYRAYENAVKEKFNISEIQFRKIFLQNFYQDGEDFGRDLDSYNKFVKRMEELQEGDAKFARTVKEKGLVGVLHDMIDSSKMGEGHSDVAKGLANLAPVLGGIYAAYKAINEYGFMKTIGGVLAGEFGLATTTGHGLFDWIKKLSYGGIGNTFADIKGKSTEELIEVGEDSKEKKEKIGPIAFLSIILGDDMKVENLQGYLKYKNGNIKSFKLDDYYKSLPNSSQKKSFIKELRNSHNDKTIISLIIEGLKELDYSDYKDKNDITLGTIIETYRKQIERKQSGDGSSKKDSQNIGSNNGDDQGNLDSTPTPPLDGSGGQSNEPGNGQEKRYGKTLNKKQPDNGNNESGEGKKTSIESMILFERVGYVEDGQYYMIGADGEPKKFEYSKLTPEVKEKLKEYKDTIDFIDDVMFLAKAYEKNNPDSTLSSDLQKEVQEWYQNPDENIKTRVKEVIIKSKFFKEYVEEGNLLFPYSDDKNDIFSLKGENRREAVYEFVRNELNQYNMVSSEIANEKFEEFSDFANKDISVFWDKFNEIPKKTILLNTKSGKPEGTVYEKIYNFFKGNTKNIEDFINDMYEQYQKAQEQLNDNRQEILQRVDEIIESRDDLNYEDRENIINKIENIYKASIFDLSFKQNILNYYIKEEGTNGDGALNLYKDIEGVGWLNPADRTWDWGKTIGSLILTEAIAIGVGIFTAGAGFYAVNTAVWGARGYRGIKWAQRISKASHWAARASKFAGTAAVEGIGFYQGMNMVHNVVEDRSIFEGSLDVSENIKSIVMMGALRGLGKLTTKIPGLKIKEGEKILQKSVKLSGQVAVEGISLGVGLGAFDVYFEGGEWGSDQLVEGLLLAVAFRMMNTGINKLNIRMRNGKPEIYTNSKGREIQYKYDKKTGEIKKAVYKDTGESVSKQQLSALKRQKTRKKPNRETTEATSKKFSLEQIKQLSPKQLSNKIKDGNINVKNLGRDKLKTAFDKLTGKSDWSLKPFSKQLRDLASQDKKEFGKKLANTVLWGRPNAKWSGSKLTDKLGYGTFATLTWLPQFYSGVTGGFENVDFEELAEDYTGYALLNRYISIVYFLNEMEQNGVPVAESLPEFTSNLNVPPERFDKAAYLPGIGDDLATTLKKWGSKDTEQSGPVTSSS